MSLSIYFVENFDKANWISRSVSIKMYTANFRQDKKKKAVVLKVVPWSQRFSLKFSSWKRERTVKRRQRLAKRQRDRKTSCYLALLSCRWQGQDLTLRRWLVDIFRNMQINLIGSFDCNYWGDAEDISHLVSFNKFCPPLPGKKIVCKISENCKGWQAAWK